MHEVAPRSRVVWYEIEMLTVAGALAPLPQHQHLSNVFKPPPPILDHQGMMQ